MVIAAYVRTLRPGVSIAKFIEAWRPEGDDPYPAQVEVAVDPTDDRKVLTLIRVEGSMEDLQALMPDLVHPDSEARLGEVVESTDLATVFVQEAVDI